MVSTIMIFMFSVRTIVSKTGLERPATPTKTSQHLRIPKNLSSIFFRLNMIQDGSTVVSVCHDDIVKDVIIPQQMHFGLPFQRLQSKF